MFTISCHMVKFNNMDTDFVLCLAHVPERPYVQRVLVMKFAHIDYIDWVKDRFLIRNGFWFSLVCTMYHKKTVFLYFTQVLLYL